MKTDKIIKDFDEFINDLCGGELVVSKKKIRKELRDIEEFIKYRKELDDLIAGSRCVRYKCPCGENYDLYTAHPEMTYEDDWRRCVEGLKIQEVKYVRTRYYCMKCSESFYTLGEIKFIRNVGPKTKLELTLGES